MNSGIIKNGSYGHNYPIGSMLAYLTYGKDTDIVAIWISNKIDGDTPPQFSICAVWHGVDGKGLDGMSPNLIDDLLVKIGR